MFPTGGSGSVFSGSESTVTGVVGS